MSFGASNTAELIDARTRVVAEVSAPSKSARVERLVAAHHDLVWRTVRRLGVPDADADDVVQEVFLLASRSLDTIEHERGFLLRTCMFVASHARRTIQRRREISDDEQLGAIAGSGARPDEHAEASQARAQLQSMLDEMPTELKGVFVLFELERFTMAEIAELLQLPAGTVASRLRRARELFATLAERSTRRKTSR